MARRGILTGVLVSTVAVLAATVAVVVNLRERNGQDTARAHFANEPTIQLFGRTGSFGREIAVAPSGQSFDSRGVAGWSFPAGARASGAVVAFDGSILMPTATQSLDPTQATARDLAVASYDPAADQYTMTLIASAATPSAPSIGGMLPLARAVVFSTSAAAVDGSWPVFGILSKMDGRWQVARGQRWANEWTARQLGLGPGGLGKIVRLPGSGDLIVARPDGDLVAIRVSGPDDEGRYQARVVSTFSYPGGGMTLTAGHLAADPTQARGQERFALTLVPHIASDSDAPTVLQEFGYDAETGAIRLVSAPLIPGDLYNGRPEGFNAVAYDHRGRLWAAREYLFASGPLALYASPRCANDSSRAPASYRSTLGGHPVWGEVCSPTYDILQAQVMPAASGLVEDPASDEMVVLAYTGSVMAVRVDGSGSALTFQVGDLVDLGRNLLPNFNDGLNSLEPGGFDPAGRLWFAGSQRRWKELTGPLDQWLYSVRIRDLFTPAATEITDTPGSSTVIQAEQTASIGTKQERGPTAATIVDSDAYVTLCADAPENTGCGYDSIPGNGYLINDARGLGKLAGSLEYRVRVRAAGTYRFGYLVCTFDIIDTAEILLAAGGRTYVTAVATAGDFRTIWLTEPVPLPEGEQTIRIEVPPGGGGWFLNSLVVRRS